MLLQREDMMLCLDNWKKIAIDYLGYNVCQARLMERYSCLMHYITGWL